MSKNLTFAELIKQGGQELNLNLDKKAVLLFETYKDLLLEWNQRINLTSITDVNEIAIKHFLDSLIILGEIEVKVQCRVVDIGTGAGFPGIPLKIARPDLNVVLVDPLQKRVAFLREVIDKLQLKNIEVYHGRAEELGHYPEFRESFDLAVARAVAKMPVLVEYNLPFVRVGGQFVAFKGPESDEEVKLAANAVFELGAELEEAKETYLPFIGDRRSLIIYRKTKHTPPKYPRKPGLPEKKPLGV